MSRRKYEPCDGSIVPEHVRFDVPGRHQGQIVECAYGGDRRHAREHDEGDPWMRVTDYSEPVGSPERTTYYRRVAS